MKVRNTARYSVKPEAPDRVVAAVREFVGNVREKEPGTLTALVSPDTVDGVRFTSYRDATGDSSRLSSP